MGSMHRTGAEGKTQNRAAVARSRDDGHSKIGLTMRLLISHFSQLLLLLSPTINGITTPLTTPGQSQPSAVGKFIKVTGKVTIIRKGLRKGIPASANVQLLQEDRIEMAPSASAKV